MPNSHREFEDTQAWRGQDETDAKAPITRDTQAPITWAPIELSAESKCCAAQARRRRVHVREIGPAARGENCHTD